MGADILVIVGVFLLLFGGRKLPQLLGVGKGAGGFSQAKPHARKRKKDSSD